MSWPVLGPCGRIRASPSPVPVNKKPLSGRAGRDTPPTHRHLTTRPVLRSCREEYPTAPPRPGRPSDREGRAASRGWRRVRGTPLLRVDVAIAGVAGELVSAASGDPIIGGPSCAPNDRMTCQHNAESDEPSCGRTRHVRRMLSDHAVARPTMAEVTTVGTRKLSSSCSSGLPNLRLPARALSRGNQSVTAERNLHLPARPGLRKQGGTPENWLPQRGPGREGGPGCPAHLPAPPSAARAGNPCNKPAGMSGTRPTAGPTVIRYPDTPASRLLAPGRTTIPGVGSARHPLPSRPAQ